MLFCCILHKNVIKDNYQKSELRLFFGTIQAFVPVDFAEKNIAEIKRIFGNCACVKMKIRPVGGVEITKE